MAAEQSRAEAEHEIAPNPRAGGGGGEEAEAEDESAPNPTAGGGGGGGGDHESAKTLGLERWTGGRRQGMKKPWRRMDRVQFVPSLDL